MLTDPLTGARKPEQTDGPLGGLQIANVIDDLAPNTVPSFANATARNTAYSNWVAAGGVMRKGLKSHTQNDDRYWRYDGSGWQYAGGAPPPIVAASAGNGWSATAGRAPGVYRDASGLVNLMGAVTPNSSYGTQDGLTHTALQLPVGFYPSRAVDLPVIVPAAGAVVMGTIDTTGLMKIVSGTPSLIVAAGTVHILDGLRFHPTYAGTLPLA